MSPLLYVLYMKVLAANVCCHPDITGMRSPWSGKRDLVARDVVRYSTPQGGFGVVSIRYKVHALWLSGSVVMLLPRMRGPT